MASPWMAGQGSEMKEMHIRRQREALRRTAQRQRDALVLAATLACHALLLFIVPGFSSQIQPLPVLHIELAQVAREELASGKATAPEYAPEPRGPRSGILSPNLTAGQGQTGAKSAAKPPAVKKQSPVSKKAAPVKPAAKPVPAPAKPGPVKDATPPVPKPKPGTPRVEPASPALPPKQKPVQPKSDPPPPPAKSGDGSGGGGKPQGSGGSDGGVGDGGKPGGGTGGAPSDDPPGPGGKPGPPGAPNPGPAAPGGKPPPEPPAKPAGPSQAELNLLEDYGAAAFKRIKSQARNSEQGVRGTVVFEFEVSRKGYLLDVRIAKSSGHNNLDSDVLEATRAAFNEKYEIVPFPKDVGIDKWVFRKSVSYPLY